MHVSHHQKRFIIIEFNLKMLSMGKTCDDDDLSVVQLSLSLSHSLSLTHSLMPWHVPKLAIGSI